MAMFHVRALIILIDAAQNVNTSGHIASDVMAIMQNAKNKADGARRHMADDDAADNILSPEELQKRYKQASRLTAGTAFGRGNGMLGPELRDEVIRRRNAKRRNDKAKAKKKEDGERLVIHAGRRVLRESKKKGFSWTGASLKVAIKYKRKKTDKRAMPTRKADLLARWDEVKKNYSIDDNLSKSEDESDDDESDDSDDSESDGGSDDDDESRVIYGSDDSDESDDEAE